MLAQWIDVYTLLIPKLINEDEESLDKFEKECIDTAVKMGDIS